MLLDDFRRVPADVPLYQPRDTHWNAAGNRLAADVLYAHLVGVVDAVRQERYKDDPGSGR